MTAYAIGVDSRTLRRWLKTSGLTYRHLIDRIRFELADDLLADPKTPLKNISAALGYSSPNNFIRAFHRISGMRPTQYRRWKKEGILLGDKTSQQ